MKHEYRVNGMYVSSLEFNSYVNAFNYNNITYTVTVSIVLTSLVAKVELVKFVCENYNMLCA